MRSSKSMHSTVHIRARIRDFSTLTPASAPPRLVSFSSIAVLHPYRSPPRCIHSCMGMGGHTPQALDMMWGMKTCRWSHDRLAVPQYDERSCVAPSSAWGEACGDGTENSRGDQGRGQPTTQWPQNSRSSQRSACLPIVSVLLADRLMDRLAYYVSTGWWYP